MVTKALILIPLVGYAGLWILGSLMFFIYFKLFKIQFSISLNATQLLQIGLISLLLTIGLDLLITVVGEKIDMRVFPVSLMYIFAWLVIVPAVVLADS